MSAAGDFAFVRRAELPAQPAPAGSVGFAGWVRANLFSTPLNTAITVVAIVFLGLAVPPFVRWAFVDAVWTGSDGAACSLPGAGACWAFIDAKFAQFIYGRFPVSERWRPNLVAVLLLVGLVPLAIPRVPLKRLTATYLLTVFPIAAGVLLLGGVFGLRVVRTDEWSGLLLTLVVATVGIVAALPLGIVLALGRRSQLPVVRFFSIAFIEFWRGVPLVTVLFMASVMLPVFFPPGVTVNELLGALIGIALFSSAYLAEVIRGGLQAIPRGQEEAAKALGLGYRLRMQKIVLPQALALVIPGIVNSFIALFKDTTLLMIIGLQDFLGTVQSNTADARWVSPNTPMTGYVFAGLVYWMFCFSMSRYALFIERRVARGRR